MEIIEPGYYRSFRCLASACPDSCCKEWDVEVDANTAALYRDLPGSLGDALRAVLTEQDGETLMRQTQGRCPMWRTDGLCEIQAQLGEQALCQVCRDFPRLRHDYGDFMELGLELSCPEAARLIFTESPVEIMRQIPGGGEPDYDKDIMDILRRTRDEFLRFLDSGKYPLNQTLAILLLYGYAVQNELDGGERAVLHPREDLETAQHLAGQGNSQTVLDFFAGLEILTDSWKTRLSAPPGERIWPEDLRAMARYGISRYWLQAVSDFDLVSRIKLIIASCLMVKLLGGELIQTAQQYSKEIENDPDNVEAVLDGAYTAPALSDVNLLGLLLA